jgi:hypothetical protein
LLKLENEIMIEHICKILYNRHYLDTWEKKPLTYEGDTTGTIR